MSRLSSAFEAPPEQGSMLAHLEGNALESSFVAKMAILLAHEDADGLASVEPLPHLDYHLIHALTNIAARFDKRAVKLFDYLIDGRKYYYNSHSSFHTAFVCLQDTRAYGLLLEREKTKLAKLGSTAAKELESNEIAIRKNYHALHICYLKVHACKKSRAEATTRFSQMKYYFLNTQMPRLTYIGKKVYQNAMESERRPIIPVPSVPAFQPCVTPTAVAPPPFESLSGMLNTDMSEEDLLKAATQISNLPAQSPESDPDSRNGSSSQVPCADK